MDYKRNLWTSILVLLAGIVLVFFHGTVPETIVRILGAMFVIAAILNLCMQLGRTKPTETNKKGSSMIGMLTAIASGALGIWMLIDPGSLVNLLVYLFAALIILGGVYQICTLTLSYKPIRFPFGFYILPVLMVACGIVMIILGPTAIANALTLIIGISLIVYAISMFIEIGGVSAFRRSMKKVEQDAAKAEKEAATDVGPIDVKAEEVSTGWPADKQ